MANQLLTVDAVATMIEKLSEDAGVSVRVRLVGDIWSYETDTIYKRFIATMSGSDRFWEIDVDWNVTDLAGPYDEFKDKLIAKYPGLFTPKPAPAHQRFPVNEAVWASMQPGKAPKTARRAMIEDMAMSVEQLRNALDTLLQDSDL